MLTISSLVCSAGDTTLLSVQGLELSEGAFNAVIGPNGAGKSTLLKALSGDIPYRGNILLHDLDLNQWSPLERARHIGVLPQSSQLSFPFSAFEVVALGLTPLSLGQRAAREQVKAEMKRTDCLHLADMPYPQLSGGEKQRVQLARVLLQLSQATKAPLLLLDEPTSAQDLGQQHALLSLTQELCQKRGYGALAILHDLNQVLHYCHHCYVLNHGALQLQGKPTDCLTPNEIETHWGYRPESATLTESGRVAVV